MRGAKVVGVSRSDSPELAYFAMLRFYHKIGFVRNSLGNPYHLDYRLFILLNKKGTHDRKIY